MGNKILITGASSDIGLAICRKLAKKDDQLILQCNQNQSKLDPIQKEFGSSCTIHPVDFNQPESIKDFINTISDLDIFIHAAAAIITNPLPHLSEEEISLMLQVNVQSYIKICSHIIPQMTAKRRGCIVCISSVAASRGNRGQSVYAGTKGFLESFSRSLASEYGLKGIRINCVAPGPIDVGNLKGLMDYASEEVKKSVAFKRIGIPEDVASLVNFLCSEEAEFIHGKTIGVDGGFQRGI